MSYSPHQISHLLGGQLIGKSRIKTLICEAICLLPDEMIEKLIKTTWFISSPDDAWALTFKGAEHKQDHLIYLSDELFQQSREQIKFTILHEIGHVLLNHRNSIGIAQTQSEIKQQERAADEFAKRHLDSLNPG